jgi:hypothetical protein
MPVCYHDRCSWVKNVLPGAEKNLEIFGNLSVNGSNVNLHLAP